MLGRKPDEFGLVPDIEGFVRIKDFLKAVCEEEGWGYVRESHVNEILLTLTAPPIETEDKRIRAKDRERIPKRIPVEIPPGELYTCVRRRAHEHVFEKGITPPENSDVILSSDREMALRIGKRIDQSPILLTVQARKSAGKGVVFTQGGETLFLSGPIPPDCFTGPPLPKQKPEAKKKKAPKDEAENKQNPGSFFLEINEEKRKGRQKKKKKDMEKGKDRKRMRREKRKIWSGEDEF